MSSGPARRAVTTVRVCALDGDDVRALPDKLVTEEPMEIRLHGPGQDPEPLAVTMRTPGNDFELAVGFCLTEGLVRSADYLDSVAYCLAGEGEQEYNVVTVKLRTPVDRRGHERVVVANASCGLCVARRRGDRPGRLDDVHVSEVRVLDRLSDRLDDDPCLAGLARHQRTAIGHLDRHLRALVA